MNKVLKRTFFIVSLDVMPRGMKEKNRDENTTISPPHKIKALIFIIIQRIFLF